MLIIRWISHVKPCTMGQWLFFIIIFTLQCNHQESCNYFFSFIMNFKYGCTLIKSGQLIEDFLTNPLFKGLEIYQTGHDRHTNLQKWWVGWKFRQFQFGKLERLVLIICCLNLKFRERERERERGGLGQVLVVLKYSTRHPTCHFNDLTRPTHLEIISYPCRSVWSGASQAIWADWASNFISLILRLNLYASYWNTIILYIFLCSTLCSINCGLSHFSFISFLNFVDVHFYESSTSPIYYWVQFIYFTSFYSFLHYPNLCALRLRLEVLKRIK